MIKKNKKYMKTLDFPLYHGTSSLFIDSIKEKGLGAVNIVKEYNLINTLKDVFDYATKINVVDWQQEYFVPKIINQESNNSNWQHGQVYLSSSENKAISYAKSNKYGSEILSNIIEVYQAIIESDSSYNLDNEFIQSILDKDYEPVIIKLDNIPIEILSSESNGGNSSEKLIEYITKEYRETEERIIEVNFRLNKVISINDSNIISI